MEESMKPTVLALTALMLVGVGAYAAPKSANRTFNGEIMDSACANMGNHDAGYKMSNTHTPKDCTLECEWAAPLSIYQLRTAVNMLVSNRPGSGSALTVRVTIQ